MRLLLDTHTFLWWDSDQAKLSPRAKSLCLDPQNLIILSVVSVWEMQIKLQLGKLTLQHRLAEIIERQRQINNIELLSVDLAHTLALDQLPMHHKDPFDRLLIAQALAEQLPILTADPIFSKYPVTVYW